VSSLAALSESVALTLLAVLPSFFNLASERIFEEEKALLLRAAALIALPATALAWRACGIRTRRHLVVLALAVLLTVLFVTALTGIDAGTSMLGADLKHHGVITWLALATIFAAMCETGASEAGRRERCGAGSRRSALRRGDPPRAGVIGLWVDWGWIDADRRRWSQALDKADHARAIAPDRVDAMVLRGYVRAGMSDPAGALADYDAALLRDPGNGDAVRGRAALLAAR
jgi:tetratricopeptide (TPR) repeat protein